MLANNVLAALFLVILSINLQYRSHILNELYYNNIGNQFRKIWLDNYFNNDCMVSSYTFVHLDYAHD
jgi:hypothetical protein